MTGGAERPPYHSPLKDTAAKALGIDVPPMLLAHRHEMVELHSGRHKSNRPAMRGPIERCPTALSSAGD
jgi:hypothetical protein